MCAEQTTLYEHKNKKKEKSESRLHSVRLVLLLFLFIEPGKFAYFMTTIVVVVVVAKETKRSDENTFTYLKVERTDMQKST